MTYNQIIQKVGKRVKKHVYYIDNSETTTVIDDNVDKVKFSIKTPLIGTSINGCELTLKEKIYGEIYVQIEATYGEETQTKTYGPYYLKEEPTYDANKKTYLHKCYDKILTSMVDYEAITMTYPCTIFSFFTELVNTLGYTNNISSLPNGTRQMLSDIYDGINYTYRDVLDDIAIANGVVFYIDGNEIKVATLGGNEVVINDDILKNKNIDFGEHYGPINSIVLSRSGESDNVYLKDDESIEQNGLCEFKIVDNQLMNNNDRSDYLPALMQQLGAVQYDIYDTELVGYGELIPLQSILFQTGDNEYSSYLFNNEITLTTGYKQAIYNERPEQGETDYKAADITDRRINQTYLIVDKQNQTIEGVVSHVDEQDEQIATIRLQYNELLSRISDIADITVSGESTEASVPLSDVNASQPISIKIHPIVQNISYLYPHNSLYPTTQYYPAKAGLKPSNTLTPSSTLTPSTGYPEQNIKYPKSRTLRFTNSDTDEVFDWILPTDLWYLNSTTYDELELSYGDGTNSNVIVTRKCQIDSDGTISALTTPTTETYAYPSTLLLTDGDYTVSLVDNTMGYLYVQLMAKNIYTTQFYTKAETNSLVSQTAGSIDLSVDQKLSNYSTTNEMNSAINIKANQITSSVSETYATKTTTNQLSSRISQTAKDITLSVNNGSTTSGITIGITKEDGTTSQATGTIEMNGLVKFSNLNDGVTTISGSNIKTGTINGNDVNVTNINASNITSGTISANKISGGTINASNINVTNLSASNITRGTLTDRNISGGAISGATYSYSTSSNGKINLGDNSDGPIMGYRGSTKSWSIAAFTTGGRFQTFDSSGNMGAYLNQRGASALISDKNDKTNIEKININDSFNVITKLNPVVFKYKKELEDEDKVHRGLIAQEVEEVLKNNGLENQIYEINKNGRYLLNYIELIPDLINCIKYLNSKIEKLERESDK